MTIGIFKHPEILNTNQPPDAIVGEIQKRLPKKSKIFEYGTGKGRNAIPLAQAGYSVYVQDISQEYLEYIEQLHIENLYREKASSAISHQIEGSFDAFLCIRLLHFMSVSDAISLIKRMQTHTKDGGLNALNFFTNETRHHPDFFFPSIEELSGLYSGWSIVFESGIMVSNISKSTNERQMFQKSILFQKTSKAL